MFAVRFLHNSKALISADNLHPTLKWKCCLIAAYWDFPSGPGRRRLNDNDIGEIWTHKKHAQECLQRAEERKTAKENLYIIWMVIIKSLRSELPISLYIIWLGVWYIRSAWGAKQGRLHNQVFKARSTPNDYKTIKWQEAVNASDCLVCTVNVAVDWQIRMFMYI